METKTKQHICPVERSGTLDSSFRSLLQNPFKILKPYVRTGNATMDLGCGPGFFTLPMAQLVGESGKVIAVDLQQGMLDKVHKKIANTHFEEIIELHRCDKDKIGASQKVDFILAFYMVHEVPDKEQVLIELKSILNPNGKILIAEPRFHVSKSSFSEMVEIAEKLNLKQIDKPRVFFSRTVVLQNT